MVIHKLTLNQYHDPNRGPFFANIQNTGKRYMGQPVYVAPAERERDGTIITYDNSREFIVVEG